MSPSVSPLTPFSPHPPPHPEAFTTLVSVSIGCASITNIRTLINLVSKQTSYHLGAIVYDLPINFHLLTRISGVEDGDEDTVMPREVGAAGSSRAPLAITSLTLFPHCLRTCATCSLLIPARSVSPIFRMWSPLHNRPC